MPYSENLIPTMTGDTAPSGVASASDESILSAYLAFNHSNGTTSGDRWVIASTSGWLQYQFAEAVAIAQYTIASQGDTSDGTWTPKTWTFKGSNDGSTWDTLDSHSDVTDWASLWATKKTYQFVNTTEYLYYRLDVTAGNYGFGLYYLSVGEMEMMSWSPYAGETPYEDGDYTVVKFLESGDFTTPEDVDEADVLLVGGSGSGGKGTPGTCYGGGGGGGGVVEDTVSLSGVMEIVIGAGGAGSAATGSTQNGGDTTFAELTAYGGHGGFKANPEQGEGGPSGAPQSCEGGQTAALPHSFEGGGGGGAGGSPSDPKNGGPGVSSSISGTSVSYGGGGGGGGDSWYGTGSGGGGNGAAAYGTPTSATANRGAGGGGMRGDDSPAAGNGSAGIVIIRFTSAHQVGGFATLDITSRHRVLCVAPPARLTLTSRHLVGYVYTPPPARLALRSRHIVNGVQGAARLALTSRHAVAELVRLTLTSRHLVRDVDPATLSLNSLHVVGFSARLALTSRHRVPRRTVILPGSDPPIEVVDDVTLYASFNGIDLNNGSTTHVLADGTDVGGNAPEYDTIRHYDGSLLIHDVRGAFSTITIPEIVTFSTAAGLSAWIAGLNAACRDGGSFTLQESDGATARTFLIAPGPEPSIPENNRFFIQHVAIFDLVLTRWPE